MKAICTVVFAISVSSSVMAQPAADSSMAETKAWMESEASALMSGTEVLLLAGQPNMTVTTTYVAVNSKLSDDCSLSWSLRFDVTVRSDAASSRQSGHEVVVVPLKDVDTSAVHVALASVHATDKPVYHLSLTTLAGADRRIRRLDAIRGLIRNASGLSLFVRSQPDGERLANAIRRAAVLCGAPSPPF